MSSVDIQGSLPCVVLLLVFRDVGVPASMASVAHIMNSDAHVLAEAFVWDVEKGLLVMCSVTFAQSIWTQLLEAVCSDSACAGLFMRTKAT